MADGGDQPTHLDVGAVGNSRAAVVRVAEGDDSLAADESGATMVEYTILIGLITVVAIALIAAVGTWVQNAWTSVNTTLAASPITT